MNNLWDAVTNELDEVKEDNERLRKLLRRVYADATSHGHCPFCRMESTSYSFSSWGVREYKHADDCELAEELSNEQ